MEAVTIRSDFIVQEEEICHYFHISRLYLPWNNGTRCHYLSLLCSLKRVLSLSSFTLIKKLFSSSSLAAVSDIHISEVVDVETWTAYTSPNKADDLHPDLNSARKPYTLKFQLGNSPCSVSTPYMRPQIAVLGTPTYHPRPHCDIIINLYTKMQLWIKKKKKKKNFHNVISFTLKVVRFHQIPGVWPNYQRLKSSKTHSHSYLKCCLTCACRQGQNLGSVQAYHKKVRGLPSSFWSLKRFTSSLPPPYLSHSLMAATNKTCCFWNIELKCPLWMTTFYNRTFSLCFIYVYNTHLIKL